MRQFLVAVLQGIGVPFGTDSLTKFRLQDAVALNGTGLSIFGKPARRPLRRGSTPC